MVRQKTGDNYVRDKQFKYYHTVVLHIFSSIRVLHSKMFGLFYSQILVGFNPTLWIKFRKSVRFWSNPKILFGFCTCGLCEKVFWSISATSTSTFVYSFVYLIFHSTNADLLCFVCSSYKVPENGNNRVFPKIDHSARSDRIVLVEHTIGSVVELNFC